MSRNSHFPNILLMLVALLGLIAIAPVQALTIEGKHYVNDHGAKVIFRGYNIQTKAPPFQPIETAEDLDPLWRVGTNLIRFNFVWEAAEPELGEYDESYFAYYDRVVDWAWQRGMYVLIDFHNNAYSRYAAKGCGSGFPKWALSPTIAPAEPKPNGACTFNVAMMQAMLSADNYTLWSDFMTDKYGVRSRFYALTRKLAERYAEHPAVIGFDLNEPMVFKSGLIYDSDLANQFFLGWQAFIHQVNPRFITFWGDSPFQFIFINKPPHLELPAQGLVSFDAHFYEPGGSAAASPVFGVASSINAIVATREKYNIPVLIGEYGVNLKGKNNEYFQYQLDTALRRFDQTLLSSARWNYTPHWNPEQMDHFHNEDFSCFDQNRTIRLSCLPRANLQVLSGELIDIHIQHKGEAKFFWTFWPSLSRRFQYNETRVELSWEHVPAQGETHVFAAREVIFDGADVVIEALGEGLVCGYDEQERYVICRSDHAGKMQLTIRAAK